jgi:hypothetical protein
MQTENSEMEVFNPITSVTGNGITIQVKELNWLNGVEFLKLLAKHIGSFITTDGKISINPDTAVALVADTKELADWLILKTTTMSQSDIDNLSFTEGIGLLEAAISMNVRADFFVKAKRIGNRVASAMNLKPKVNPVPLPKSSTSLSGRDIVTSQPTAEILPKATE